jgi:hypothetical protein
MPGSTPALSTGTELSLNVGFESSLVGGWSWQADQLGR